MMTMSDEFLSDNVLELNQLITIVIFLLNGILLLILRPLRYYCLITSKNLLLRVYLSPRSCNGDGH